LKRTLHFIDSVRFSISPVFANAALDPLT